MVSGGGLAPVLLMHGSQKFLVEESLKEIKKRLQSGPKEDLNYQEFQAEKAELSEILSAAETLPFISEKRLIVVKESEKLKFKDSAALMSYLKNPSATTCLVFVAGKVDKRSALYKGIKDYGKIDEYSRFSRSEYLSWINRKFFEQGKKSSYKVANLILNSAGQDLNKLEQEIEKVSLYLGEQKEVREEDVNLLIEKTAEDRVFDLVDALGRREKAKALEIANRLLKAGESPVFLLNMIIRQFRLLLRTKALLKRSVRGAEMAKTLRVLPFVASKMEDQSRRFTEEEIVRIYELLLEADVSLKTSSRQPHIALDILINKI